MIGKRSHSDNVNHANGLKSVPRPRHPSPESMPKLRFGSCGWFKSVVVLLMLTLGSDPALSSVRFQTGKLYPANGNAGLPGFSAGLVAGDFDGDGRTDFAVSVNSGQQISIMRTMPDGSVAVTQQLQTGLSFSANAFPFLSAMAVGDFNGDGRLDIAFSLQSDPAGQSLEVFMNDGTGNFSGPIVVDAGVVVDRMVSGDFNRDGRSELAILARRPSAKHNNVFIFGLGPQGSWIRLQVIPVQGYGAMAAGDFNGDGILDLLVGNEALSFGKLSDAPAPAGDLLLIPGSKTGLFGKPEVIVQGIGFVSQLGVADLNHDNRLDLILSVFTETGRRERGCQPEVDGQCFFVPEHKLLVLLAAPKKTTASPPSELFSRVAEYLRAPTGCQTPILMADFNGDGEIDVSEEGDVLLGDGTGHFKRIASYVPAALAATDVNRNGKVDLVSSLNEALIVLPGNGDGTFQGPVGLPSDITNAATLDGGYIAATAADFNGDGRPDIAMYALNDIEPPGHPTHILVYLNRGNGVFGEPTTVIEGSQTGSDAIFGHGSDLLAGDLNGDGNLDLVTVGGGSNLVTSFLGIGNGTFRSGSQSQVGQILGSATVQDFNRDGALDIAAIEAQNSPALGGFLYALVGNGDGSFSPSSTVSISGSLFTIEAGDFLHSEGDDRHTVGNDVAALSCPQGQSACGVDIVSSLSKSAPLVTNVPTQFFGATVLATGDFNHDGYADIVVGGFDSDFANALTVFLGDGDGHFSARPIFACSSEIGSFCPASAMQLVVADFNGDGHLDLLTDNYDLFLGKGDGTFIQSDHFNVFPIAPDFVYSREMHVADVNGDGAPDIIATPGYVLYNAGGTSITTKNSESVVEFHRPTTITAIVKPSLKGTGIPTGKVDFYDDSALPAQKIATGLLVGEQATVVTSNLSVGTHMIRAQYLGDGNFNPHSGKAIPLTVTASGSGQAGSGTGQGGANEGGNCAPTSHERESIQTLRSIDPGPSASAGASQLSNKRTQSIRQQQGDLKLAKPRIPQSPVAPEGELAGAHSKGLPITGAGGAVGFDGLTNLDSLLAGGAKPPRRQRSVEPSDQAIAVNEAQAVQVVNSALGVYSRDGRLLSGPTSVNAVFGLSPVINPQTNSFGPFVTDPRILWDSDTNRWFISALEIDTNPTDGNFLNRAHVVLAVSQTADAMGAFYQYSIDITDPTFGNCPCLGDQPLMGTNQDGLFITTDQFSFSDSSFQTALVLAIDKYDLARGMALRSVALQSLRSGEEPGFAIQPARFAPGVRRPTEHGGTEYFVSSLGFAKIRDNRLAVWSVTNTSSLRTSHPRLQVQETLVTTETYSTPDAVQQHDGPRKLSPLEPLELVDTGDDRVQQVFYSDGKLYTSLTTAMDTGGVSQSAVAWFVLDASADICPLTASLIRQGYVVASDGTSLIFPAFVVDRSGKGVIAFSMTGKNLFPSVGFVEFDGYNIKPDIHVAATGVGPEDGFSGYASLGGNGEARWGDYSAATVSADGEFWFASGYIPNKPRAPEANWGTFIGHLSLGNAP